MSSPIRFIWLALHRIVSWLRSSMGARLWLRRCNAVGPRTRTFWKPDIQNRGRIEIGARVRLNSNWAAIQMVTGPRGQIRIGDGVFINYGTLIAADERVEIGADVMIGNYCIVADTETPGMDEGTDPPLAPRPVHIGAGAWLAARVTVLPGARIGEGAVIAAGSIVAGEIPAGSIAGGIPARVIRMK